MKSIVCQSFYGNSVEIPREKLMLRLGVYALIVRENSALLMTNRNSGKLAFPGGGVDLGEKMENALRRELREEAGIEIEILRFLTFRENFFYYDPKDIALHGILFYYLCDPCSDLPEDFIAADEESEKPRWVDLSNHSGEEFQNPEEYELVRRVWRERV